MEGNELKGLTVGEVAALLGGRPQGDASVRVVGIGPVDEAGNDEMAFLASKRYSRYAPDSKAAAFLVSPELALYVPQGLPHVVVADAYPALRTLLSHFYPLRPWSPDIHPTAILGTGVTLGPGVAIGPYTVIEDGARVGARTRIGAHCVLETGVLVGQDCHLHPQVVVCHECVVGDRVIIHSGARIGSDGFGFTYVDGAHLKMPQVGRAIIEDDVEIGANTTIDRGSLGDTVIGQGSKLDNLIHMAHNVKVGAQSLFAALVGVAGSTRIGKGVWMGGQVGVSNHLHIGDGARLAIATKLMRDVPAGETVSGHPSRPHRQQMRQQAHAARIPKLVERVKQLEAEVEALRAAHDISAAGRVGAPRSDD